MDDYILFEKNESFCYDSDKMLNQTSKNLDFVSSHGSKLSTLSVNNLIHDEQNKVDESSNTVNEDVEPALRRSKRGKGRPGNNQTNSTEGSTDDHVHSCIVADVEYRTGKIFF